MIGLEAQTESAYFFQMDDSCALAPSGWLEALAVSEAQLAARQIVDGDEVMRELDACIADLEAKQATGLHRKAIARR